MSVPALVSLLFFDVTSLDYQLYDCSNELFKRARLVFKNGYRLSIVIGPFSYGGRDGLFEIAIITPEGNIDDSALDDADQSGSGVLGYCDVNTVRYYISKISEL
jgi:hypothetical protein